MEPLLQGGGSVCSSRSVSGMVQGEREVSSGGVIFVNLRRGSTGASPVEAGEEEIRL